MTRRLLCLLSLTALLGGCQPDPAPSSIQNGQIDPIRAEDMNPLYELCADDYRVVNGTTMRHEDFARVKECLIALLPAD